MKCVDACPVNKETPTLTVSLPGKKQTFNRGIVYSVVLLMLFIVPVVISTSLGTFESEEPPVYETANDIRGSYAVGDIAENYGIELGLFYKAFNLSETLDSATKIKDLEEMGVSVEGIRTFVEYINRPINELTGVILPENIDPSQTLKEFVKTKNPGAYLNLLAREGYTASEENEEDRIKRVTMLVDIKRMVDNFDGFRLEFGIPEDKPLNTEIRELIDELGIELEEIRTYVEIHNKLF